MHATEADRLTALAYLQVTLTDEPALSTRSDPQVVDVAGASVAPVSGGVNCIDVTPRSLGPIITLQLERPASLEVRPSSSGAIGVQFRAEGATGRLRPFDVVGGGRYWLNLNVSDIGGDVILPPQGITTLCGLARLDDELAPVPLLGDGG